VAVTSLSVFVALAVGGLQLIQLAISLLKATGPFADAVAGVLGNLGYVIVGPLLAAWCSAAAIWKFGRLEEKYGGRAAAHAHFHAHDQRIAHTHRHFR
jgi:high-affinity nickel-transport protein